MAEEPMEVSTPATTEVTDNKSLSAVPDSQLQLAETEVSVASESKEATGKTDESGRKVYSEEDRLRRKAYFKAVREKKKLAQERYRQNKSRRSLVNSRGENLPVRAIRDVKISFNMTEEEDKLLEFYKVKLSALRSTNEQLHKRLAHLVDENIRLLQMGPPLRKIL